MTRFLTAFALIVCLALPAQSWAQTDEPAKGGAPAKTDEQVTKEMEKDVVLRALVDELERGKVGLKLEDLQRPYFIEYALVDATSALASADLGSLTSSNDGRARMLRTDIRVGSYDLDNTNYSGDDGGFPFRGMFGGMSGANIPIDDDYNAIRQGVWWATDREYKSVVENYESKLAFMKTKLIEDKPSDFSKEAPTVYFEERTPVMIDKAKLEHLAIELSKIFKEYPDIQDSGVTITGSGGNKYLVNSEGTRIRVPDMRFALSITANVQADDGMKLSDAINIHGRKWEDIPGLDDLAKRCREMVKRLLDAKKAPKLENYSGPVLIDAEAAAALFSQRFANRFAGGQRDVGSDTDPEDFENKIGERILPKSLDVIDDPTREQLEGQVAMGHYKYDDQGVKVAPLTLVEQGQLKAQVMSRNPSKKFKQSNGHGRGVYRPTSASTGCLIVSSTDPLDEKELEAKLLEKWKTWSTGCESPPSTAAAEESGATLNSSP